MSKPNVTIDITSPGIGTGAALWVTDSGNWYGVVTSQELSVGTGNCGTYAAVDSCGARNACIATGGPYSGNVPWSNPSYCSGGWYANNCTAGSNASNCSGGWYTNNCTVGSNANNCVAGTNQSYWSNCAIYGPSASQCGTTTEGRQRYDNCKTGGNCVGTGGNCRSYGNCLVYGSYYISCCKAYNAYNSCGYRNPCVGGYIYWTVEVPNSCCQFGQIAGTPNPCLYGMPSTPNNCVTGSPGYYDECRYGQPAASGNYFFSGDSYNPCGAGSNCIQTGGNCTNYLDTYPRQIKVFRYASNVLTQVASQTLDSITNYPIIRSLRVVITNATKGGSTATITTKTYSDALFTSQIGADMIHQATGLKINTNYGIIANPSTYNQDISAQSVSIY